MKASGEHRKVRYTKMVIRESFFELLERKELREITVKELCELADINRGTFYSHYMDIHDLVEKLGQEYVQKMKAVSRFENIGENNQMEMFIDIFSHIKNSFRDFKALLLIPSFSRYLDEILAEVYEHHALAWRGKNPQISENMIEYSFAFLASGSTRVIHKWIENDFEESPEEIAKFINAFTNVELTALIESQG